MAPKPSIHGNFDGKSMQSISVKAVLTSLFALLVLMIGGLGLMAIAELAKTNAHVSEFSDDYLPSIDELGDINAAIADIRYMGAEYIFANDTAEQAAKAKELGEAEQRHRDVVNVGIVRDVGTNEVNTKTIVWCCGVGRGANGKAKL